MGHGATDELSDDGKLMLVLIAGGQIFEFDLHEQGAFSIGRSPDSDIHIDAESLSPTHAILRGGGNVWALEDAGSETGTSVNGADCAGTSVTVRVGQRMQIGEVIAQLRWTSLPSLSTRSVSPAEFERRVRDEIERCVRFEHSLAAILVEVGQESVRAHPGWATIAAAGLRAGDIVTIRSRQRIDVAVAECSRAGAIEIAERMRGALAGKGIDARVGIATYPDDVPSAENLLFAAQQAMDEAGEAVGIARDGVRVMRVANHEVVIAEPSMIRLFGMIERVANANFPLLVRSEAGSGKDVVARAIHVLGRRASREFVRLNCADALLERELFGYVSGAFDGATEDKPGLIDSAEHGTLLLDHVGELPLESQAKLLRVIVDGVYRPLGATEDKPCDVRVVAATHRDLKAAAAEGTFIPELYYRLSVIVLDVPALRDRPRTIPLLAARFAAFAGRAAGRDNITVAKETLAALVLYRWPGNIRELRNVINAAVQRCDGNEIQLGHMAPEVVAASKRGPHGAAVSLPEQVRELERTRILEVLEHTRGNQLRAAALLGIPRGTLSSKIQTLGIDDDD